MYVLALCKNVQAPSPCHCSTPFYAPSNSLLCYQFFHLKPNKQKISVKNFFIVATWKNRLLRHLEETTDKIVQCKYIVGKDAIPSKEPDKHLDSCTLESPISTLSVGFFCFKKLCKQSSNIKYVLTNLCYNRCDG